MIDRARATAVGQLTVAAANAAVLVAPTATAKRAVSSISSLVVVPGGTVDIPGGSASATACVDVEVQCGDSSSPFVALAASTTTTVDVPVHRMQSVAGPLTVVTDSVAIPSLHGTAGRDTIPIPHAIAPSVAATAVPAASSHSVSAAAASVAASSLATSSPSAFASTSAVGSSHAAAPAHVAPADVVFGLKHELWEARALIASSAKRHALAMAALQRRFEADIAAVTAKVTPTTAGPPIVIRWLSRRNKV